MEDETGWAIRDAVRDLDTRRIRRDLMASRIQAALVGKGHTAQWIAEEAVRHADLLIKQLDCPDDGEEK